MRALYESILDTDFDGNLDGVEAIYTFESGLQQFKPKNEVEAFIYWLAIRKAFFYIMTHINDAGDTVYTNKLKLQMLEMLVTLPGKAEVPYWDGGAEDWRTSSTEDKWFRELITMHYEDIEKNNFRPWASHYSSGNLMHTFFEFDDDLVGYGVDPDSLPERLYSGFDEKKYETIKKKLYSLAQRCVNKLKHMK